ncbi:MAG: 1,4-dihydroxy-2-naphthoate polyprenyltransferase [Endomicrobiales bacterium]
MLGSHSSPSPHSSPIEGEESRCVRPVGRFKIWLMASRPQTLPAAVVPVCMAYALAVKEGAENLAFFLVALACALGIQILANFVNDYADFLKGTDSVNRIGPARVMQSGLVTRKEMHAAIALCLFVCIALGSLLVARGGAVILAIGILSIVSGILYTAGPVSLGYKGLGDIFVLIFFGPVAVFGTYYVQSLDFYFPGILIGIAPGLISTAILAVNNIRDHEGDARSAKKTLVVRFGRDFGIYEYYLSLVIACLIPVLIYAVYHKYVYTQLTAVLIALTLYPLKEIILKRDGPSLNKILAYTGTFLMIYGAVFIAGCLLS